MWSKMLNKGISPVIATVILVAVALLLAVALTGWVIGIWGTIGATEAVQIVSASLSSNKLNLTVINKGSASATIISIVAENETITLAVDKCGINDAGQHDLPILIAAGNISKLNCTLTGGNAHPGFIYTVKLTTYGGTYTYDVRARGGQ